MVNKRWYLAKFYYYLNIDQLDDPFGDHVLLRLTKPLFADVRARNLADFAVFMRFSEGGAHIRMRFYIDPSRQSDLDKLINQHVTEYRHQYHDYFEYEMRVSPVGEIINRNFSPGDQKLTLNQPGDLVCHFVSDQGNNLEGLDINENNSRLQDAMCALILDFFSLSPSESMRKLFVRTFVVDLFDLLKLSSDTRYRVLSFLKKNWISYFQLSHIIDEYFERYETNKTKYHQFFIDRQDLQNSYRLFPKRFQEFYRDGIQQIKDLIEQQSPIKWDNNGDLTPASFMNVYSYFHLNHNRSDVSLFQEVFWAHVLIDCYTQSMNADQLQKANEWLDKAHQLANQFTTLNTGTIS